MKLICCAAWLLAASPAFAEGPAPAKPEVKESKEEKEAFKVIHVKDLVDMQSKDKRVVIYDANGSAFRADYGVIPGAKMLSSSSHFAMSEMPEAKDTPIVFYCANSH